MKTKYILASMLLSTFALTSCVDMDTVPEGDIITTGQKTDVIAKDPSKAAAGVNAIFSQFSTYMTVTGSRHNDFGYPSIMLMLDTNGYDFLSEDNGYNWYGNDLDYTDRVYTSNECKIAWNSIYQIIYAANNVIGSIDAKTTDNTQKFYLGQALAARAFDYWVLAQMYQFNYADHKTSPCVPLITEANAATAPVDGCKRSTVEEVYAQITSDINNAITMLKDAKDAGQTRADKRYIDLGVAYGLRARINLTMEKWAAAAEDAASAITESGAKPYSIDEVSVPTMYDSADSSIMWAVVISEDDRVVTSGIINWPSHMGSLNYGYAEYCGGRQINKKLYNTIPDSDVRKGWWLNENKTSNHLNADFAYMVSADYCGYPAYTQVKFAPYKNVVENSVNANDIPLMRVEEMYLIKAEGEAMSGKAGDALNTLVNFIKTYRDPSYSFTSANPVDIQEEIYRQRRIELWGEGLSWFDIMRLKKNVDRRGAGYPNATVVYNIKYGDNAMLWRFPESEIQANPALEESDNNPAAAIPSPVADE